MLAADFNKHSRDVTLDGEAYFEIKHAPQTFILHAAGMDITDLGTIFNVRAYKNEVQSAASLIEGKIVVHPTTGNTGAYMLLPLQKLVLNRAPRIQHYGADTIPPPVVQIDSLRIITKDQPVIPETAWVEGKLVFSDETLQSIAFKLENWYGVEVTVSSSGFHDTRFSGVFSAERVEDALRLLQSVAPKLRYRITGNKIIFY